MDAGYYAYHVGKWHQDTKSLARSFNLKKDPWETFNLANFPEYEEIVETRHTEMKAKAQQLGDVADSKRSQVDFWKYY
jgi:arylsulfatase A-like enzyme